MSGSHNKDYDAYLAKLRRDGFYVVINGGNHYAIWAPDQDPEKERPIAVCPTSSTSVRGLRNLKAEIKQRTGRSKRGQVAAPPPQLSNDPAIVGLYRLQVRVALSQGRRPEDVMLAWKVAKEPIDYDTLVSVLVQEEEAAKREGFAPGESWEPRGKGPQRRGEEVDHP